MNAPRRSPSPGTLFFVLLQALSLVCPSAWALEEESPRAVALAVAREVQAGYVLEEVANSMAEALRSRALQGQYDHLSLDALAERLTKDLREVSHDGHIRLRHHADPEQLMPHWNAPGPADKDKYRRAAETHNHGFRSVKWLEGNVGYVRLDEFGDLSLAQATADACMRFVTHTDALIFDLRENGGGADLGRYLASYLLRERTLLSTFHLRREKNSHEAWTETSVSGPRYLDKPVYILIGPNTASAAEHFAYTLQAAKRVTVVGETSAGAANPGRFVRVSEHLAVFVPDGRPVSPVTGTNWEGVGVQPDVVAPAEDALEVALKLARGGTRN